jgi:hypothetical protein
MAKLREAELNSFLSADPWYRGEEVDNLSKQEAAIIEEDSGLPHSFSCGRTGSDS